MIKKITPAIVRSVFPRRPDLAQKWEFGHCLIVAGSRNLLGAALLATKAALRSGAGLVTLALPKSLQSLVYSQILEALTLPLEETSDGSIAFDAAGTIQDYVKARRISALVLGPGISRHHSTQNLVRTLDRRLDLPIVLDADALINGLDLSGVFHCLTPHEREFARLLGGNKAGQGARGTALAQAFVRERPGVALILKGHQSKIFWQDQIWSNPTGNPGMAKGGSGDVLSGILGSLLAQAASRSQNPSGYLSAVLAAAYLHGLAGDLASKEKTSYGSTPLDIIEFLPHAMKSVGVR